MDDQPHDGRQRVGCGRRPIGERPIGCLGDLADLRLEEEALRIERGSRHRLPCVADAPLDQADAPEVRDRPATPAGARVDVAPSERARALRYDWRVTVAGTTGRGKGKATTVAISDLLASLPAGARRRAERIVRALEAAERELDALLDSSSPE